VNYIRFFLPDISIMKNMDNFRRIFLALVMVIALTPMAFGAEPDPGEDAEKLISQGYELFDAGKHSEAERRFKGALSIDSHSLSAHEGLMWVYHDAGDTAKALKHADAMRQLAPADPEVLKKWMVVSTNVDDRKPEVLATAILLDRNYPEHINTLAAHEDLMWIYHDTGDTAKALQHADAMRQLAPEDLEVLKKWMVVSITVDDRRADVLAASRLLEENHPDHINTLAFLGNTFSLSEDFLPQAIQIYEQLLEEEPDNPDALRGLAHRAKFDGDLVTALELLERAEQAHPSDSGVRSDLEEIRNDAERLRSARVGPTLPIVIAIAVLPLLFGSMLRRINMRSYILLAVYTMTVSVSSLLWLFLVPLE
jgi:tetratricopeptide (TPR) repeat protein